MYPFYNKDSRQFMHVQKERKKSCMKLLTRGTSQKLLKTQKEKKRIMGRQDRASKLITTLVTKKKHKKRTQVRVSLTG